jgi:hypothetical protein
MSEPPVKERRPLGNKARGGLLPDPALKTPSRAEAGTKKGHFYRPLKTQFRLDGFDYRQIVREGACAIYEQTWAGCPNPHVRYEVIRIRRREGFHIGKRFIEPAEVYPNSESWGVDGFTFTDKDAAFTKLREIACERIKDPW